MAPIKALFVAEKNSVAKAIVAALGGGTSVPGPSRMNPITECRGTLNSAGTGGNGQAAVIHVTSVQGHLMEMDFKGNNRKWGGCAPAELFDAEVEKFVPEKFKDNAKQLQEQARWCDWLVLWLDCDREGENIAFEVIEVCTSHGGKPRAQLRIWRAKFSDVERTSVLRACTSLVPPNKQDADAVDARSEIDLRTGAAFTRFQTKLLQGKYHETQGVMLSYGPCQFPTLGFVVARDRRIEAFRPEDFWYLDLEVLGGATVDVEEEEDNDDEDNRDDDDNRSSDGDGFSDEEDEERHEQHNSRRAKRSGRSGNGNGHGKKHKIGSGPVPPTGERARFSWARNRCYDQAVTTILFDLAGRESRARAAEDQASSTNNGSTSNSGSNGAGGGLGDGAAVFAVCTSVRRAPTSKQRPCPMNTVKLQLEASTQLRMASERVMKVAEELYSKGILSYPRTETERYSDDFDLTSLVQHQRGHPAWGTYAARLLDAPPGTPGSFQRPRNGKEDDKAHPPIHPVAMAANLSGDEEKVYELVTRHFLATCSGDARGERTQVKVMVGGEEFNTSGTMITDRGYLDVYRYDSWKGSTIPVFLEGRRYPADVWRMQQGTTTPPRRLSQAELIQLMDKEGIGTDATMATHIATIQQRGYATCDSSLSFCATQLGLALVDSYRAMGRHALTEPKLRAQQELDCKAIATNQRTKQAVLTDQRAAMRSIFELVSSQNRTMVLAASQRLTALGSGYNGGGTGGGMGGSGGGSGGGGGNNSVRTVLPNVSDCGTCGGRMNLLADASSADQNRGGFEATFVRCGPCQKSYALPRKGKLTALLPTAHCPLCNFQVLAVGPGNGYEGKGYHVCPHCYNHPPDNTPEANNGDDMPCFKCAAQDRCPLAGRSASADTPLFKCRSCNGGGEVFVKKSQKGKWFVSCGAGYGKDSGSSKCSATIWLPGCVTSAVVLTDDAAHECRKCTHPPRGTAPQSASGPSSQSSTSSQSSAATAAAGSSTSPALSHPGTVRKLRLTVNLRSLPPGFLDPSPSSVDGTVGQWDVCLLCHKSELSEESFGARYKDFRTGPLPAHVLHRNNSSSSNSGNGSSSGGGNTGSYHNSNNSSGSYGGSGAGSQQQQQQRPMSRMAAAAMGMDIEDTVGGGGKGNRRGPGGGRTAGGGGAGGVGGGAIGGGMSGGPLGGVPVCEEHGIAMVELTVRKEGPNQGRLFFKCGERDESSRCQAFAWADELGDRAVVGAGRGGGGGSNGGGNIGGGGGGSGGGVCFKCQQPGHFSRDCPNQGGSSSNAGGSNNNGGGGGGGGVCFKCQQPWHYSRDCPNQGGSNSNAGGGGNSGGGGGEGRTCFKCGQSGHWANRCPN